MPRRPASRLFLVRHGESTWNRAGWVQGQAPGISLTRAGRAQAEAAARRLEGEPIAALYSSDLQRAAQTARPLAERLGLAVRYEAALRERHLGSAQGGPAEALGTSESGIAEGRVIDPDAAPPGGESIRQLWERSVAFVESVVASPRFAFGDVVVVTHGGVVRVLLAWSRGQGLDDLPWVDVANGAVLACPPPLEPVVVPPLPRPVPAHSRR